MFKIYDGRDKFFQWDLDRKLIVEDRSIAAAHFCNRTGTCSLSCDCYEEGGKWLVDVPNVCLQDSYRLKVYGFCENKYTMEVAHFDVVARTKPEDYVYTEEEVACWEELDERIKALEEDPVSEEVVAAAIEAYLVEHPITGGATEAEKEQIARNAEDIAALKAKADTYATEEYVDNAIANIEVGGGESEIEIVNASGEETIEVDKTYQEIMAMIEAGKVVVIKYDGNLYYQYSDTPAFRYVGEAETRYIGFNPRDYSVRYNEAVLPTYEDVGTIVNEAITDFQTAEQVQTAIENYVGVIENGSY